MSNNGKSIATAVRDLVAPIAAELGYTLWDVEYVKEGTRMILRITIDSNEGVTIDDCEKMHRAVDPVLDEADPIESSYYLEVSSPGIERELKNDEHLAASIGQKVELRLYAPVDGKKSVVGLLESFDGQKVSITTPAGTADYERSAVAKIRTVYDFGD